MTLSESLTGGTEAQTKLSILSRTTPWNVLLYNQNPDPLLEHKPCADPEDVPGEALAVLVPLPSVAILNQSCFPEFHDDFGSFVWLICHIFQFFKTRSMYP